MSPQVGPLTCFVEGVELLFEALFIATRCWGNWFWFRNGGNCGISRLFVRHARAMDLFVLRDDSLKCSVDGTMTPMAVVDSFETNGWRAAMLARVTRLPLEHRPGQHMVPRLPRAAPLAVP